MPPRKAATPAKSTKTATTTGTRKRARTASGGSSSLPTSPATPTKKGSRGRGKRASAGGGSESPTPRKRVHHKMTKDEMPKSQRPNFNEFLTEKLAKLVKADERSGNKREARMLRHCIDILSEYYHPVESAKEAQTLPGIGRKSAGIIQQLIDMETESRERIRATGGESSSEEELGESGGEESEAEVVEAGQSDETGLGGDEEMVGLVIPASQMPTGPEKASLHIAEVLSREE